MAIETELAVVNDHVCGPGVHRDSSSHAFWTSQVDRVYADIANSDAPGLSGLNRLAIEDLPDAAAHPARQTGGTDKRAYWRALLRKRRNGKLQRGRTQRLCTAGIFAAFLTCCLLLAKNLSFAPPDRPVPLKRISAVPTASFVTANIEDIRLGDWVLAENPEVSQIQRRDAPIIDPANSRVITLHIQKADGGGLDCELLRSVDWVAKRGVRPGATVNLDLSGLGAAGPARVLTLGSCPSIGPPPARGCRVVTGRFAHSANNVLELRVDRMSDPIGVTANHRFWSDDRQAFVPVGELRPGERLLTADDKRRRVLSATEGRPQPVYNLEVDFEHVYYVSTAGLLVHNEYEAQPGEKVDPKKIAVYRGGEKFKLKPGDVQYNKAGGMKKRGPSVNTNPADKHVIENGGPHQGMARPDELEIVNSSGKPRTHLEVVPKDPATMTVERSQELLHQIPAERR